MEAIRLSRKQFVLGLVGGGVAVAVGCGDDETGDASTSGAGAGATSSSAANTTSDATSSTAASTGNGGSGNAGGTGGTSASSNGGAGGSSGSACTMAITATIFANHNHVLDIPLEDIEAGAEKTYSTTGTAMHCHKVTLTAADFMTLKMGGVVTVYSCTGTDHQYVLSCAPGAPEPVAPDCNGTPNLGACP